MTTADTNGKGEPDAGDTNPRPPTSGHGAASALNALIKRRVPPPEPPPSGLGDEDDQ